MADKINRPVKIKQKFYKMAALVLLIIISITSIGIFVVMRAQTSITQEYEEITLKYNAINDLEENLTQVLFRARGYYAFQDQGELESLYSNLDNFRESIADFESLPLTEEEQELNDILSNFYTNYTTNLLPTAIGFVQEDDYASLRELSSGGTNADINRFLEYTSVFNDETQLQRDDIYSQAMGLVNQFTAGFVLLGIFSTSLLVFMISRLLKDIINPLGILISATVNLKDGKNLHLNSDYQLEELSVLAHSFNEMSTEVRDKEDELMAQNEELISQQDELEFNQNKMQEYLKEIEIINKALDQSALLCITDHKGIILQVNEMFCKISKYKPAELIGNTTRVLKSGHQGSKFYRKMWDTITKGKIWNGKIKNEAKDGSNYWVNATIVPFLNEEGKAYRYILIGIDITDNKHNEQVLKELLSETQRAKEKTDSYSNLNKELTATVNRDEFLERVFAYFKVAFDFDKGVLASLNQKQVAFKGLTENDAKRFISDDYSREIIERLKNEAYFVVKRESTHAEAGIATDKVYSYDLYTSVKNDSDDVELVFAITRIGNTFTEDEGLEISILMGQLSIALSRIDIYEDVQRERSLNESIVQNVTEGLQLVSINGDLLQANEKLLELVDIDSYKHNKTIPKEVWISDFIVKCKNDGKMKEFFEQSIDPEFKTLNSIRCQLAGDEPKYIQIYTSSVFINEVKTGTIFMYRDITKEYEVDAMKSELVSTVSHELRTPLSSVLGFTEMLLMKELKPEKQKKYLETIFKEAKRLTNLINDFLDVQRIESGKQDYEMKEVTLNKVIMEVIDSFKYEKNHTVYFEDSASITTVTADRDRMVQLFTNLISNAVKFSPAGGNVAIKITNVNQNIVVSIKDSGIGIPESEISEIFTKFKRIDNSASKKIGGTGLGLAISKGIVEAHNGEIWIESEENVGTTVNFSLPVIHLNAVKEESSFIEESPVMIKGSVLLVEDDISLATMLSESLKLNGFNVIHYLSSETVVEIASKRDLIAIVVDLMLEDGLSGWELIKVLQTNQATNHIPIIISSAIDKTSDGFEDYSIYEYLVKPYSPEILSNLIIELSEKNNQ